ncbi:TauD/TfdA family dioxygenase [Kitasatospora sp. NPDC088779]|uniref:TauD/TfdA family dioxygenase n=1 Tax=Kitasatospora sp. NPDC088779 TaxID=3154964 RepID=UPI003418766E
MPAPTLRRPTATPQLPSFTQQPAPAVTADHWSLPDPGTRRQIAESYAASGYAVVHVPGTEATEADLTLLADALGLGRAFTPAQYASSPHTSDGVSRLTAAADPTHPFQDRAGQNFHSDGTLQHLGQIATTIMLCARPAHSGGHTLLFNAIAAFADLKAADPEAAAQLTHPRALLRTSTFIPGLSTAGPAFGHDPAGRLITRYSLTATDTYHPSTPEHRADLERALAYLKAAADPGLGYRCQLTLAAGQALVLANDRLCHGRTSFSDDPAAPRLLLRGLYTARPAA